VNNDSIQDLFSRVAADHGGSPAIDRAGRQITYGELEIRSNRVANALLERGVAAGTLVAILAEDPIAVVTAILGILKAGGVFVPLDPSFPPARLQAMATRVEPPWWLAESRYRDTWERIAPPGAGILPLDGEEIGGAGDERPRATTDRDAPCSIYFTSGSTGRPKAILGRLKGIDHFARWESELLEVGRGTRVSQLASPAFDGFLKDVFVPLAAAGVACAPESRDLLLEPARLVDWIDVEGIEILHCVPSLLRAILNQPLDGRYFGELRWVVLAGEVLQPADVRRFGDVFGDRIRLLNLYGPTETTVTKLFYVVDPADAAGSSIPIGTPMPGAAAMVLNPALRPCPPGVVGEIYIRTPYAALGYHGDPELTREAFVPNPFNDDPRDRIYRTGDFGRQLANGNLEFLGRRDQQVKIRGVRVEMGEVENLLRSHPGVKDVAVIDLDDAEGFKLLGAYLVLAPETATGAVREYVAGLLPESMVPSVLVEMQELPRTLNGKVDRRALPTLDQVRARRRKEQSARQRTPVEEIVAGIWCEVLRLPAVGLEESFFELGGHSLLATQILSRVREAIGVELPLRALFEAPTVAKLASQIEDESATGRGLEATPIVPVPRQGPLPLSYSQQRMWLLEQLSAGSSAFNVPLVIRPKGELNLAALPPTFAALTRRHEILRTTFPAQEGLPVQVIGPATDAAVLPLIDLSTLDAAAAEVEAGRLVSADARRPFDHATAPPIRIFLIRMAPEDHVLALTLHHMAGDAWAFHVLATELALLYESFSQGRPSSLPDLPIQFADYAAWERRTLSGELLERRLAYWRRQLEGAPDALALPQRRPRSAVQSFGGERLAIELASPLTAALRALSRREGVTLYMTLLSGFLALLHQYSGQEDLVVGTVIANRDRAEVEKLVGFLANTLVLRVDCSGGPTFRELLGRVREVCLEAYAHQVPPEVLVENLDGDRGAGGRLFDVWFQMESQRPQHPEVAGLGWGDLEIERGQPRFELSMVLMEGKDTIAGEVEFDAEVFSADTVTQIADDYLALLAKAVAAPDAVMAAVLLASQQEAEQLSRSFSANLEA
jgi:amino acid adenylation domain-containing protein